MPQLDQDRFLKKAKRLVVRAHNAQVPGTPLTVDDVYIVTYSFILGMWKAMVSTDKIDGMYSEVTYNGAKKETYVDIYAKVANYCISDDADNVIVPSNFLRK